MRVLTLDPDKFSSACGMLGKAIIQQGKFDVMIGIRTGGSFVADELCKLYPELAAIKRIDITLQRPSTRGRKKKARQILKKLPRFFLNFLRIAESLWDGRKHPSQNDVEKAIARVELPHDIIMLERSGKENLRFLIVDDAADSGVTLSAITQIIEREMPESEIITAVLAATRKDLIYQPDIKLFDSGVLLRFPWSNDYKDKER